MILDQTLFFTSTRCLDENRWGHTPGLDDIMQYYGKVSSGHQPLEAVINFWRMESSIVLGHGQKVLLLLFFVSHKLRDRWLTNEQLSFFRSNLGLIINCIKISVHLISAHLKPIWCTLQTQSTITRYVINLILNRNILIHSSQKMQISSVY